MTSPPNPDDESERLRAVELYRALGSASDRTLDELTSLAAIVCDAPISLVLLIGRDRLWFRSRFGVDVTEAPREITFCTHAIGRGEELFVVEDAGRDERFAGNPLVLGPQAIRFYAGAPLQAPGGQEVGTLCVLDRRPRTLDDTQREALKVLGRAAVAHLELRRAQRDLTDLHALLPMCAWCRAVRRDDGRWQPLHEYVTDAVPVTHGICPGCAGDVSEPAE